MKVSVVICAYSTEMKTHLDEAVKSVLSQSYSDIEVVVVIDGNQELCEIEHEYWNDSEEVVIHCNETNLGLSLSRNKGIERSSGEIIAFMDDDAVADEDWVAKLVDTYEENEVEAAGGRMTPIWVAGKPSFVPEEFFWLVGVTHRGFPSEGPVRNTFGSNISFRASVLEKLSGFDEQLGRKGDKHVQGEETELAARLRSELDGTLYYNPEAKVGHKVFEYRTQFSWLVKRAFWQGYSKHVMAKLLPDSGGNESDFLKQLLTDFLPARLTDLVRSPSSEKALQLGSVLVFTAAVGLGYGYGIVSNFRD